MTTPSIIPEHQANMTEINKIKNKYANSNCGHAYSACCCQACKFLVQQFESLRNKAPLILVTQDKNPSTLKDIKNMTSHNPNLNYEWVHVQRITSALEPTEDENNWGLLPRDPWNSDFPSPNRSSEALVSETGVGLKIWQMFYTFRGTNLGKNFDWNRFYTSQHSSGFDVIRGKYPPIANIQVGSGTVLFYKQKNGSYIYDTRSNNRVHFFKGLNLPYFFGLVYYL